MWPFKYPYSNFHELNLDWILNTIKDLKTKVDDLSIPSGPAIPFNVTGFINIADTGDLGADCIGDGITDNSVNLNRCMNYAKNNHISVFVPAGRYIAGNIDIPENVSVFGVGWGDCTFIAGGPGQYIFKCGRTSNISGIGCDCAGLVNYGFFSNSYGVNIEHCMATRAIIAGFALERSSEYDNKPKRLHCLRNCLAWTNLGDGIYSNALDVTIDACEAVSNGQNRINGSNFHILSAVKMNNCHGWNMNDALGFYRAEKSAVFESDHSLVNNCHFEGGRTISISVSGNGNVFNSCFFYATFGEHTMEIDGVNHIISNCVFGDIAADGEPYQNPLKSSIKNNNALYVTLNSCSCPESAPLVSGAQFNRWFFSTNWIGENSDPIDASSWQRSIKQVGLGGANGSPISVELKAGKNPGTNRIYTINAATENVDFVALNGVVYFFINNHSEAKTINAFGNGITLNPGFNSFVFVENIAHRIA